MELQLMFLPEITPGLPEITAGSHYNERLAGGRNHVPSSKRIKETKGNCAATAD